MSWWLGKDRSEFSTLARTRNFSTKTKDNTSHAPMTGETMPKKRGRPKTSCYEAHKESIKKYQERLILQGLCESGDGNATLINQKTGKHYRRCPTCTEKRAKYDVRRERRGQE